MSNHDKDDWATRQLLAIQEMERIGDNQREHQQEITGIGKDVAVLKAQIRLVLYIMSTGFMAGLGALAKLLL
jgi:hypothetical protein